MEYRLLKAFESLFSGTKYLHRRSHLGDHVASFLVDDLYLIDRSPKLKAVVDSHRSVLNTRNKLTGKEHRRGDGMFGAAIPGAVAIAAADHVVHLGEVAQVEIGTEVKILAKAMIKQLDRVGTDMLNQLSEFRRHSPSAICVGIVAINSNSHGGTKRKRSRSTERPWYELRRSRPPVRYRERSTPALR
jgi:hypothetical protein